MFDVALALAEAELSEVKCWCPDLYPQALQIQLSMILSGMAPSQSGEVAPSTGCGDYVAYVVSDKVGDVERQYTLKEQSSAAQSSTPANLLAGIIARCKGPAIGASFLARSFVGRSGCGCGPYDIGDKAERSNGD